MTRRTVPLIIGFLAGTIVLGKYFLPQNAFLDSLGTDVVNWRTIVAAFALGLGAVNLLGTHTMRIARKEKGWDASIVLVASLVTFTAIGLFKGTTSPVYQWGFNYLYQPIYSGISSLLAFMITSASYRSFRFKDWQSGVLMLGAVIVMLGQVGIGELLFRGLPAVSSWIMAVPNTAGMRGIAIGGALGAIALSLRVILGLERGYLGGGQ